MSDKAQKPPGTSGGTGAIRGFLVQTLVALLEVAQADPPFTEITLEPALGDEQFDFLWIDQAGTHATQVKSTTNFFKKPDVKEWAGKLQAARSTEHCCLMLVGIFHPSLEKVHRVGKVAIQKKNLDLPGLLNEAAQGVAMLRGAAGLKPRPGDENLLVAKALVTQLEIYSTERRTLRREAFLDLLRQWIIQAPTQERKVDLSHFNVIKYAPAELLGRDAELKLLHAAWSGTSQTASAHRQSPASTSDFALRTSDFHPHVLTFVALGGEGKTSLVAKWAAELAAQDWPGCDAGFAWSFYSQGTREQQAASSDLFLKAALTFFGDDADQAFAASPAGAFEKGQRLARLVGQRRSLLILDGLEPLQYAPTAPTPGELKDQGVAALLKGLAAASHGLCVVTTRYSLPDLRAFWQTTAPEVKLLRLSRDAGVLMLKTLGVRGTAQEFATLVEDVKGHALTLTLLGSFLHDAHEGDIRKRDLVKFEEADAEEQGGHAFRVMAAYERAFEREGDKGQRALAILRLLGLFDRPMTADCFAALLKPSAIPGLTEPLVGLTPAQLNLSLTRLESARLITLRDDDSAILHSSFCIHHSLDAHPHLREYFARQLRTQQPDAWRAAHRRLYEHLCASTPDKPQPTLEDLQPLYQAVAHGCQAGLHEEVYTSVFFSRIQKGNDAYPLSKLGAFGSDLGAVACFFDEPWKQPTASLAEERKAVLFNRAAFRLRALGRLTEAIEPMRMSIERAVSMSDWKKAAINTNNLSELELTLGEVAGAVGDAEQSVTYADRSGDAFHRESKRTTLADALHQAGRRAEAETRFREAEEILAERQPANPLLYGLSGFEYCDLLLAAPERAAWQICVAADGSPPLTSSAGKRPSAEKDGGGLPSAATPLLEYCRAVSQRAAQTLKIVEAQNWLLDIALDHLTLGRATLYAAILESCRSRREEAQTSAADRQSLLTSTPTVATAHRELDAAVSGLRRAGQEIMLPHSLLTRAWLRFLTGARTGPESAQADLDEAWEIAERGPMPLFLADIHLYRARLFGKQKAESREQKGESGEQKAESGEQRAAAAYPWESPQADLAEARRLIEKHGYHRRDAELADAQKALSLDH